MNERIKQFADQCRGDPMTSAFEPRFDKEKFAELIVRECATLAYDGPNGILEHFGVEEEKG